MSEMSNDKSLCFSLSYGRVYNCFIIGIHSFMDEITHWYTVYLGIYEIDITIMSKVPIIRLPRPPHPRNGIRIGNLYISIHYQLTLGVMWPSYDPNFHGMWAIFLPFTTIYFD